MYEDVTSPVVLVRVLWQCLSIYIWLWPHMSHIYMFYDTCQSMDKCYKCKSMGTHVTRVYGHYLPWFHLTGLYEVTVPTLCRWPMKQVLTAEMMFLMTTLSRMPKLATVSDWRTEFLELFSQLKIFSKKESKRKDKPSTINVLFVVFFLLHQIK